MFKNTDQRYGLISKALHWAMALIILALLSVGFFMTAMDFSPQKLEIYGLHKSFGMLILMLVGLRIIWKGFSKSPAHIVGHAKWERALSKFIHILLYIGMIGMPMSGWIMSSAGEFPNIFFGLFEFPALTGKSEALFKLTRQIHTYAAYSLIAAVGLHMAGAFKHHFIDRDETLQRMSIARLGVMGGAILALIAGVLLASPIVLKVRDVGSAAVIETADVPNDVAPESVRGGWIIDLEKSHIHFEATQYGQEFSGGFKEFSGEIIFDPDNLSGNYARIEIDIASIFTGSNDRDDQARGGEWFDVASHPVAIFEVKEFERRKPNHSDPNHYLARGVLTLRGVSKPVLLPFSLSFENDNNGKETAIMGAQIALNRVDFGVGQGQWKSAETIGSEVILDIYVQAEKP